jgi:hypothetical protein
MLSSSGGIKYRLDEQYTTTMTITTAVQQLHKTIIFYIMDVKGLNE